MSLSIFSVIIFNVFIVLHQLDMLYFVTFLLYSKFFTADHLGESVFFWKL